MRDKNRVKEFRFFKKMTQDQLYLKTKIWPSRLSKIERGIYNPTPKEQQLISKALQTKVKEVFPEA